MRRRGLLKEGLMPPEAPRGSPWGTSSNALMWFSSAWSSSPGDVTWDSLGLCLGSSFKL